jgi:D-serine deaminase-like pyridoxal phosphate-dependent protein
VTAALETPYLRVDPVALERNLAEVAEACAAHGVALRPHVKSHKCATIARRQLALGAAGLTCAKLSEAEVLARHGCDDLFVCYPLVGAERLRRLRDLARAVRVRTIVDSEAGARELSDAFAGEPPLDVLIKLDVGMHRAGVAPEDAPALAAVVDGLPGLRLRGVCIHEGSVYGEPDAAKRADLARAHVGALVATAVALRRDGHAIDVVSAGATPAWRTSVAVPGVTELRPGNYVFYDALQAALGVVGLDRCALTVETTVVSHAAPDRALVDAGSKVLTVDRGAHGGGLLDGYGVVVGRPGIRVENLSEEHGWLRLDPSERVAIGDRLRIVPNHACVVVAHFDALIAGDERWPVEARGCLT